jgi:hypothetical protein
MFDLHICASSCTYFEDSSLRSENNIFEALFSFFFVKSFFASAGVFRRKIFCEKQPVLEMVSASLFYEGSEENVS